MLLQLNLSEIIRKRAGKRGKWIPSFLLHGLERIVRQDELNELLRVAYPLEGSAFSRKILEHLGITLHVEGLSSLASAEGPLVFASNHPLGGLDGIALVAVLGEAYGDQRIRVMVNDLLMNVTPLSGVFLPVNKYGSGGVRESSRLLAESMEAGRHIVMFPAGLVSRLQERRPGLKGLDAGSGKWEIRDLEWKKSFVSKALEHGRCIVPVRFEALNSMKFYRLARWRKRMGIGVNIEQALLPSELCRARGRHFSIRFGAPVDPAALRANGLSIGQIVDHLYLIVNN